MENIKYSAAQGNFNSA
jgi:hypothetical protein